MEGRAGSILFVALLLAGCGRGAEADGFTALDFKTHAAKFPLVASAHAGIDCNTCHGAFSTFTQYDCLNGCHAAADTDPLHAGEPDYRHASDACYACHPTGVGVNHEQYFPIARGKHSGIACATCHTQPGNRKVFSCLESPCHPRGETDGHHRGEGDYAYDSMRCYACHRDGRAG